MQPEVFISLGHRFFVHAPHYPSLAAYVRSLLAAQRTSGGAGSTEYLFRHGTNAKGYEHALARDGKTIATAGSSEGLIGALIQRINVAAIESWTAGPICHAGGVARGGQAIVLPADQEAGKTTLVTALVRAGFDYITDEAVAFDEHGVITPFPKPLSIDPGSWHLFPELEPREDLPSDAYKVDQWQVPPDAIRPGAVSGRCRAAWLVFPRYRSGAQSALEPITRAEALIELSKNTFGFSARSRELIDPMAEIVRGAECHRLVVGGLDEACDLIEVLVTETLGTG
jgi:hypothetical protein